MGIVKKPRLGRPPRPKAVEYVPFPTVYDIRATIIAVKGDHWLMRSDAGLLFGFNISNIDAHTQRRGMHLLVPGAVVEFDVADGFIAEDVRASCDG